MPALAQAAAPSPADFPAGAFAAEALAAEASRAEASGAEALAAEALAAESPESDPAAAPPPDARAQRLKQFKRDQVVVDYLNRGVSVAEIAARFGVGEKRMRAIVREILGRRLPAPPREFLAIQTSRLNEALLVAFSAMGGDAMTALRAVDRVVKVVRELDRYHGFVPGRALPRRWDVEAPDDAPAGALYRAPATARFGASFAAAMTGRAEFAAARLDTRPEIPAQEPEKIESAPGFRTKSPESETSAIPERQPSASLPPLWGRDRAGGHAGLGDEAILPKGGGVSPQRQPAVRPPSSVLPHKSLRPGARERGPGGGGGIGSTVRASPPTDAEPDARPEIPAQAPDTIDSAPRFEATSRAGGQDSAEPVTVAESRERPDIPPQPVENPHFAPGFATWRRPREYRGREDAARCRQGPNDLAGRPRDDGAIGAAGAIGPFNCPS